MPELPEVEVVRQGLQPLLVGRRLGRVRTSGKRLRRPMPLAALRRWADQSLVVAVRRRGKYLLLDLENDARVIFHLGMTGRLGLFPATTPRASHDHLCLGIDTELELRFNDTRRFGSVQVLAPGEDEAELFAALGPEPLEAGLSAAYLRERAARHRQAVKSFLMDSRVVVGIGNIYASEILHEAKISPLRPANGLTLAEWRTVVTQTREVLRRAIKAGGSTIANFVNSSGQPGYFQLELAVYGREGQACRRCGQGVVKETLSGRATYRCPGCQR